MRSPGVVSFDINTPGIRQFDLRCLDVNSIPSDASRINPVHSEPVDIERFGLTLGETHFVVGRTVCVNSIDIGIAKA